MTNFVLRPDNNRDMVLGRLQGFISALSKDKPWLISIELWKAPRSVNQNRYLWSCCYPPLVAVLNGVDAETLHEHFLEEFFGVEDREMFGKVRKCAKRRSSKLNKAEFSAFVNFIQQQAEEQYGIYIPDANPMHREQLYE